MKQTNMRMLALCAALCLCVATAAPAYAESTRQTPRTSFVETLLDIPVLGDILRFFSGEEPLSQAATAETATGETATPETSTPETAPTATPETATPTPAPTPGGSSTPESAATLPPTGTPQVYPAPDIVVMPTATPAITAAPFLQFIQLVVAYAFQGVSSVFLNRIPRFHISTCHFLTLGGSVIRKYPDQASRLDDL